MTAPETTKPTDKSESRTEERRSYVIRDEDDSDDDDLIDVDEESERKGKLHVKGPIMDSEVTICPFMQILPMLHKGVLKLVKSPTRRQQSLPNDQTIR